MEIKNTIKGFSESVLQSIVDNIFVAITLGNYKGLDEAIKNIYIKKIEIKKEVKLSFTYRYKTNDIVKNYTINEAKVLLEKQFSEGFKMGTLFTTQFDLVFENRSGKYVINKLSPSKKELPSLQHDIAKNRIITAKGKSYLTALKITDANGNVYKATQDKYKQINHYVEILSSLVKEIPQKENLQVVDMGAGKGYLTFALYDYLTNVLGIKSTVTGVEFRANLVALCNSIATDSNYKHLHFVEGSIEDYQTVQTDVLIALHACDTATDDAICKGINTGAALIVVAPCCHKQIRREIEKNKVQNELEFITRHGIFLERQAEMITDAIRAMILEYYGYKTKVFEFITDAHTPKNIMIAGVKNNQLPYKSESVLKKIKAAKRFFGINTHQLENILGI